MSEVYKISLREFSRIISDIHCPIDLCGEVKAGLYCVECTVGFGSVGLIWAMSWEGRFMYDRDMSGVLEYCNDLNAVQLKAATLGIITILTYREIWQVEDFEDDAQALQAFRLSSSENWYTYFELKDRGRDYCARYITVECADDFDCNTYIVGETRHDSFKSLWFWMRDNAYHCEYGTFMMDTLPKFVVYYWPGSSDLSQFPDSHYWNMCDGAGIPF